MQEQQNDEENAELADSLETPFPGNESGTELELIRGDRIFGVAYQPPDSAHLIADLRGNGTECDIVLIPAADGTLALNVSDRAGSWSIEGGIEGLIDGRVVPSGGTVELAAGHLTGGKSLDLLCAVYDGSAQSFLTIFVVREQSRSLIRAGTVEGERLFHIRRDGTIKAPYGTRGLSRSYQFNGASFEEIQEPDF